MPLRKSLLCWMCLNVFIIQAKSQEHIASTFMNKVSLHFGVNENGIPQYSVSFNGKLAIKPSRLGFIINDSIHIDSNFQIIKVDSLAVDETWKPVWGEVAQIRNHYKQVTFHLQQQNTSNLLMNIVFKVFEDGVGFRYEFPVQPALKYFTVSNELTQFNLTGNHKTFWIPGDYDSNEYPYTTSKISEVDAWKTPMLSFGKRAENIPDEYAVQTPLMMKTADGLYINIHEAECFCIGSPPEHETIMPFTRLMGGPMDYTPGIFIYIFRKELMEMAKISEAETFYKNIWQLHEYGYIKHIPSYNHFLGSLIFIK